jgi:hypothetical protein
MNRILTIAIYSTALFGNLDAGILDGWGNPFVDFPKYDRWKEEMSEGLQLVFEKIIPEDEQAKWKTIEQKGLEIGQVDEYARERWIPRNENGNRWTELVTCLIENVAFKKEASEIPKNISELVAQYKVKLESDKDFLYEISVISKGENDAFLEIKKQTKGVSGLLKKNTLIKSLERIVLIDNWTYNLSYDLRPHLDEEKGEAWQQLRDTWIKRFSTVQFNQA